MGQRQSSQTRSGGGTEVTNSNGENVQNQNEEQNRLRRVSF